MRNLLTDIYIKPDKSYVIAQYKSYRNGPRVLTGPLSYYDAEEWKNLGNNVSCIMREMCDSPTCEEEDRSVLKVLLNGKSWKKFTQCYLCISFLYNPDSEEYTVTNEPREQDGGYGVTKGKLTERYSTDFGHVAEENLLKYADFAYEEGLAYLRALDEPWCRTYLSSIPQK